MSKKSKRQVSRSYSTSFTSQASKPTEFNPDYTVTKHELKRIGILAGCFVALMIVLAIFQNQILGIFLK